jgi:hypothetical protein
MATYPIFGVSEISAFSGRPVSEYTNAAYVPMAVAQATLLFKLGTCLGDSYPDDPTMASLASMAISAMADAIYLVQPFQAILSNPFSSETIGSYSYSKVAGAVMGGLPTGITWFDLALSKLSVCELNDGIPMGGGIEAFEWDGKFASGVVPGNVRLLSPQDFNNYMQWTTHDPSEGYGVGFAV